MARMSKEIFDFMGLPAELRNMVYEFAKTPLHDPGGGRVSVTHQQPGEYRDFTGLPLVCKAIYEEYTPNLRFKSNNKVTIHAEHLSAYIDFFYSRGGIFEDGSLHVIFTAYGDLQDSRDPLDSLPLFESSELNLSQLFRLRRSHPMVEIMFRCFIVDDSNDKPVDWPELAQDLQELLYARNQVFSPAPRNPSHLARYFAGNGNSDLSLFSRWPAPGGLSLQKPAIVLKTKYRWGDPRNRFLPFASTTSTKQLAGISQALWSAEEVHSIPSLCNDCPCDHGPEILPDHELYEIPTYAEDYNRRTVKRFLCAFELCDPRAGTLWYLNFQLMGPGVTPLDKARAAADTRIERIVWPLLKISRYLEQDEDDEVSEVSDDLLTED